MEQSDEDLARLLQEQEYNDATGSNAWQSEIGNASPITIPDNDTGNNDEPLFDLDTEAPFKDLHHLFLVFNDQYFESKLSACEVRWSPRMTRCAGLCYYQSKAQYCSIRLSEPLLKFRPESDYIDTLLHEMIQPLQPADKWYAEHQEKCGGTYTKISQPETAKKKTSSKPQKNSKNEHEPRGRTLMDDYFSVSKSPKEASSSSKPEKRDTSVTKNHAHENLVIVEKQSHPIQETIKTSATIIDLDNEEGFDRPPPRIAAATAAMERYERQLRLNSLSSANKPESSLPKRRDPGVTRLIEVDGEKPKRIKTEDSTPISNAPTNTTVKNEGDRLFSSSTSLSDSSSTHGKAVVRSFESGNHDTPEVEPGSPSVVAAKIETGVVLLVQCPICSQKVEEATINDHVDLCIWRSSGNA
ncbi:hypothetical protein BGX27_005664 [Mortierella sp. AM989]|nr:hypothetical protein BGX27_005664 [Mortierella sp. AM989]